MWTHVSKFLSAGFRQKMQSEISARRQEFRQEMDNHTTRRELYFGNRFHDDEHCYQGFVMRVSPKGVKTDFEYRQWATQLEHEYDLDRQKVRLGAWQGLESAASTDHWYQFEKQW